MKRFFLLLASGLALGSLSGCAGLNTMTVGFAIASAAAAASQPVSVVYAAPPGYMLVPEPEAEPDLTIPDPPQPRPPHGPQFQAATARNLLAAVSMEACAESGLPAGYGHARVTFAPEGNVSGVFVDAPASLPAAAAACVSQRLSAVVVPAFGGAPMTAGTQWLLRG
jgi:hypothetical protein